MKDILTNGYNLIYLVTCALHGRTPEPARMAQMDLAQVYQLAKFHALTTMAYMAVDDYLKAYPEAASDFDTRLLAEWKTSKNKALYKQMMMDAEREAILAHLEEQGVWYMPLKGVFLKDLYPKTGMREMVDNDILFDINYRKELRRYMVDRGYKDEHYGGPVHDMYLKLPFYNFEMHVMLYARYNSQVFYDYYKDVKSRLIKDADKDYGYHFSDEDFYIFVVIHAFKHYESGGFGIRTLLDLYVYTQAKKDTLDWAYLDAEMDKLGVAEFERNCRKLADKLFDVAALEAAHGSCADYDSRLTEEDKADMEFFLSAGSKGTTRIAFKQRLDRMMEEDQDEDVTLGVKLKYLYKRLFPEVGFYESAAPVVYRHKVLLPFYMVYRLSVKAFKRRGAIWKEIKHIWKTK